jgi:signal transduction histidine kinase
MQTPASRPTRPTAADGALVAVLAVFPMGLTLLAGTVPSYRGTDAVALALAGAGVLALLWRQVAPIPVLAIAGAVVIINAAAGYQVAAVQWPVWVALYTCFAWHAWGGRLLALAITGAGVGGYLLLDRGPVAPVHLSSIAVCVLFATVAGEAVRSRRAYTAAIEARLRTEERERAMLADRAVREERTRWARELHDAVGHAVNVMVLQAGVGRRVFAENPGFVQDALRHIETVGREALDELDRLLRAEGPPEQASDLSTLADRVRSAGREIDLSVADVDLSPGASRALYRIVQEAVTNALRHSSTGRIRVGVGQAGSLVVVEVHNAGEGFAVPVPGRGLINMRERARLEGGQFEAGPVADGFRVRATLPARRAVQLASS